MYKIAVTVTITQIVKLLAIAFVQKNSKNSKYSSIDKKQILLFSLYISILLLEWITYDIAMLC